MIETLLRASDERPLYPAQWARRSAGLSVVHPKERTCIGGRAASAVSVCRAVSGTPKGADLYWRPSGLSSVGLQGSQWYTQRSGPVLAAERPQRWRLNTRRWQRRVLAPTEWIVPPLQEAGWRSVRGSCYSPLLLLFLLRQWSSSNQSCSSHNT